MNPATELRLGFAARADNLALVRQALAGLADAASIPAEVLADLKQIATEACMNAVVHAYPEGDEGPVEVVARADAAEIEVRVRDWGAGFRPRPADAETSLRLGLPLIASIADSFEVERPRGGGTAIAARVRFNGDGDGEGEAESRPDTSAEAAVAITAGASARPVIARVLAIAGTRAGFSLDRMSDGVLLGDAIAAGPVGGFAENRVGIAIDECGAGGLCVSVGPLVEGGAQSLLERMELPGIGASVSQLADRVDTEERGDGEYVIIELGHGSKVERDERAAAQ